MSFTNYQRLIYQTKVERSKSKTRHKPDLDWLQRLDQLIAIAEKDEHQSSQNDNQGEGCDTSQHLAQEK